MGSLASLIVAAGQSRSGEISSNTSPRRSVTGSQEGDADEPEASDAVLVQLPKRTTEETELRQSGRKASRVR